jgi:hypothetical protein
VDLSAIHPDGVEQLGCWVWPLTREQGEKDVLDAESFAGPLPAEPCEHGPAGWYQPKPLPHATRDNGRIVNDIDPH